MIFSINALSNPGTQINLPKFLSDFWQVMGSEQSEPVRVLQLTHTGSVCHGWGLPVILFIYIGKVNYTDLPRLVRLFFWVPHFLGTKMWVVEGFLFVFGFGQAGFWIKTIIH